MLTITPSGTPGVYDARNPTLIPSFDKPVMSAGGTLDHQSPASFLAANPRTDATITATIGGTITAADTVAITLTSGAIAGGSITQTYTVGGADTTASIANSLATLFNNSAAAQAENIRATVAGSVITIYVSGPVGNTVVATKTAAGTETVTFSGTGGALTGGTGPVFAVNNFTFHWKGTNTAYWYGQPYIIPTDALAAMAAQGMPIT